MVGIWCFGPGIVTTISQGGRRIKTYFTFSFMLMLIEISRAGVEVTAFLPQDIWRTDSAQKGGYLPWQYHGILRSTLEFNVKSHAN